MLPGVDAEAMRRQVNDYFAIMKAAYSERDYLRRPTSEIISAGVQGLFDECSLRCTELGEQVGWIASDSEGVCIKGEIPDR